MSSSNKAGSVMRIACVILAAAGLVSATRRYGVLDEGGSTETTEPQTEYVSTEKSPGEAFDVWQMSVDIGKRWLPLSLPFLVGLGLLEVVLFHTTVFYIIGTLKDEPARWGRSRLSAALALGVAWGVQMALAAGLLAVAARVAAALKDGSFRHASAFSAFCPLPDQLPLLYIMYATLIVTFSYWIMLTIFWRIDERKKSKQEELEGMVKVEESMDLNSLPVTKL